MFILLLSVEVLQPQIFPMVCLFRRINDDAKLDNVKVEKGNILHLNYADETFDKVIAANVIHLLEHPEIALGELLRVCKKGGEVIIPTYLVNHTWGLVTGFGVVC